MSAVANPPTPIAGTRAAPPASSAAAVAALNLRLTVPRSDAVRVLRAQLERGMEIKKARIRYVPELEKARAAKGEWTARTLDIFRRVFDGGLVAEEWGAWVGRVLPEYADLALFIEHFYDEMDQRLRRLGVVIRRIQELPDSAAPRSIGAASANPVIAAVLPAPGEGPLPAPPGLSAAPGPISPEALGAVLDQAAGDLARTYEVAGDELDEVEVIEEVEPIQDESLSTPSVAPTPITMVAQSPAAVAVAPRPAPRPASPAPAPAPEVSASGLLVSLAAHPRAREAIEEFIRKLGFEVQTIESAPAEGDAAAPLAEKIDRLASLDFAVVLVDRAAAPSPFDLGYCAGRLGHRRVYLLSVDDDRVATDPHGLLRIPLDPAEGWQLHLARQFKRAGLSVDLNRVF